MKDVVSVPRAPSQSGEGQTRRITPMSVARPDGRRVVVTGLGVISPLGLDAASTWEAMRAGRSGVGKISHFDASDFPVRIAGEVSGFDPEAVFGRRKAKHLDRVTQMA